MARLVEQLPSISIHEGEKEIISKAAASQAKNKGWQVRDFNGGKDADGKKDSRGIPCEGKSTAIEEPTARDLRLYPNPASDYIVIEGAAEGTEVRLLSLDGRTVLVAHLDNSCRVDVSYIGRDTYLLQVGNESQVVILK